MQQHTKAPRGLVTALLLAAHLWLPIGCTPADEPRPAVASFIESEKKLYSERNEELLIRHFFQDRRGGFFLDVGAYDWKNASTTLYLEHHLDWTGISIDANKGFGGDYARYRPGTKFLNYFVTDHSGGTETLLLAGPLSSQSEEHIRTFLKDRVLREVEVPAITLDDLLDQNGVTKLDFLSMDIELGEPAALAGFDIERFQPELVCIEAGQPVREQVSRYFREHGYVRIDEYLPHDHVNWYFRPGGS